MKGHLRKYVTCAFNYETFYRRKKNSCLLMETASVIPCKFLKERWFQESCEFFVNSEKGMLVKCELFVNSFSWCFEDERRNFAATKLFHSKITQ